jgi:hypothetical protein
MPRDLVLTWLSEGADELPRTSSAAAQTAADIEGDLDRRLGALHAVADDVYERWATGLRR